MCIRDRQMQELAISDAFEHVAGRNGGMPVLKWQKLTPVVKEDVYKRQPRVPALSAKK